MWKVYFVGAMMSLFFHSTKETHVSKIIYFIVYQFILNYLIIMYVFSCSVYAATLISVLFSDMLIHNKAEAQQGSKKEKQITKKE